MTAPAELLPGQPPASNAPSTSTNGVMPGPAGVAEAGPSRPRAIRTESNGSTTKRAHTAAAAASPTTSLSRAGSPTRSGDPPLHLDLATYPTPQLLRLLASLLQQIASSNDQLRSEHDDQNGGGGGGGLSSSDSTPMADTHDPPPSDQASATSSQHTRSSAITHDSPTAELFHDHPPLHDLAAGDRLFTAAKISLMQPSSILSFHARHVPSITIEAYLLRILKYCPTTNEVFLGLLVYFDRMSKLGTPGGVGGTKAAVGPRGFAIDSYNVHRLIIAGVTVASKFFSDVFYTNSRYAKVGGLPPHELNQLELQFLLLNNFTLMIPPDEMQRYGDRLLAYWQGREEAGEVGVDSATASTASASAGAGTGAGAGTSANASASTSTSASASQQGTPTAATSSTSAAAPPTATARAEAMDVDERPTVQRQPSATAPGTPSHSATAPPVSSSSTGTGSGPGSVSGSGGSTSQLTRSASVPRRAAGEVPMRPSVSFAPRVQRDSVVGVGP